SACLSVQAAPRSESVSAPNGPREDTLQAMVHSGPSITAATAPDSLISSPTFAPPLMALFFFFQAEDGIRGGHVTGVQTCALPILELLYLFRGPEAHGRDKEAPWLKRETGKGKREGDSRSLSAVPAAGSPSAARRRPRCRRPHGVGRRDRGCRAGRPRLRDHVGPAGPAKRWSHPAQHRRARE